MLHALGNGPRQRDQGQRELRGQDEQELTRQSDAGRVFQLRKLYMPRPRGGLRKASEHGKS